MGEATLSPAAFSIMADYFPKHKLARAFSVYFAIHPPETTVAILECLGLPTRAPPLGPAVGSDDDATNEFELRG